MQTLNFFICDQVIEAQCPGRLVVAQTRGHLFAQFALDQEWEGLNVTAVFSNDFARKSYQRILTADPVEVPKEVLAPGRLFVSLVGLGDGGAVRLTTKRMDKPIIVYRAGDLIGLTPEETTPDLWEQAMSAIGRLDELQTSDKSSVVAAINAVLQSGGGGSVDPDAIAQAVADYMAAHPIQETDPTVPAWAKQPQKPTYTAAEVGALPDTYTPPVDDALSETSANPVQNKVVAGKLSEIEAIAKGRATGYVFDTESDMRAWIASNASELNIGDNLYIRATDVPDYWWDGTAAQPLETQKVDLTEYAKKSEVPAVDTTLTQSGQAADAAEVGARLSSLSEEIANLPQADWNQNDETAADFVKNRPFYTGDLVETVLVEESTVSFADAGGAYMALFKSTFSPTVGEIYKVYWDGAAYECTCLEFSGNSSIGNLSVAGVGSDTGEPFLMLVVNSSHAIYIYAADTAASHTFSISGFAPEVVKIDEKYLPAITADKLPTIPVIEFTTSIANNIGNDTQPSFTVSNLSYSEIYALVEKGNFQIKDSAGVNYRPIRTEIRSSGSISVDILVIGTPMTYANLACSADRTSFYRNIWWQIEATKK